MASYIREKEDYFNLAIDALRVLSERGVLYVEFTYNYQPSERIDSYDIAETLIKAFRKGTQEFDIEANLIINFFRVGNLNEAQMIQILDNLKEFMNIPSPRICGINISGQEVRNSSFSFIRLYNHARELGLNTTVHTGEDGDSQEI